jgi:hypothetical protein
LPDDYRPECEHKEDRECHYQLRDTTRGAPGNEERTRHKRDKSSSHRGKRNPKCDDKNGGKCNFEIAIDTVVSQMGKCQTQG